MTASKEKRIKIKKEVRYLEDKESIRTLVKSVGYENILRYMVEDLDRIEDVNNTQSMYLFQLLSLLEQAVEIYPRLGNV